MGRIKYIRCQTRMRGLRSNNMNKLLHQHQSKYPMKTPSTKKCPICQKSIIIWLLPIHIERHYNSTEQNIKSVDNYTEDVETNVFTELYRQLDVKQQEIDRLQGIIQSQRDMLKDCDRQFAQKETEISGQQQIDRLQVIIQSQHDMLKDCDRKFAQKETEISGLFKIIHSQIIDVDTLHYNSKNKRWEKFRI